MAITLNASTSSGLVQTADTSGVIELQNNGTTKLTVNSSGVNIGQYSAGTSLITSGTAVSASGTSVDFTGIPSWVKRITVMFHNVSTNGSSNPIIQLGTSGGFTTSGYAGYAQWGTTRTAMSNGFMWSNYANAASAFGGIVILTNVTSNTWAELGNVADSGNGQIVVASAGSIGLSGTLTQVRVTTTNGTDTFDAGTINILYE